MNLLFIEITAVVFTLICVYLTAKNNIWCWPTGIIGVAAYFLLFWHINLYAEVILQTIYLAQCLYGWYNWSRIKNKPPAPITNISSNWYFLIIIPIALLLYFPLNEYTNASIPLLDSITTSMSLVANWILAKRIIQNWYLWISVDILYIIMFAYKGIYLTAVLYFVLLILSVKGLKHWKKELSITMA